MPILEIKKTLRSRHNSMKQRCLNKHSNGYEYYGGRGIKVCKRWLKFVNFYNDMFSGFRAGLTLDRINTNRGYSKKNCRWATWEQQANNRRERCTSIFSKEKRKELNKLVNEYICEQKKLEKKKLKK